MILLGLKIEELSLNSFYLHENFYCFFSSNSFIYLNAQDVDASDILFLKIQELEGEIATLEK